MWKGPMALLSTVRGLLNDDGTDQDGGSGNRKENGVK